VAELERELHRATSPLAGGAVETNVAA
jgi:hypothetical protein